MKLNIKIKANKVVARSVRLMHIQWKFINKHFSPYYYGIWNIMSCVFWGERKRKVAIYAIPIYLIVVVWVRSISVVTQCQSNNSLRLCALHFIWFYSFIKVHKLLCRALIEILITFSTKHLMWYSLVFHFISKSFIITH